jgi:hypothetical protein
LIGAVQRSQRADDIQPCGREPAASLRDHR